MSERKAEKAVETVKKQTENHEARTVVYCGPSIRGVARQFTVYSNGVPGELRAVAEKHPVIGGLIVPLNRFANVRAALYEVGTAENILYEKAKELL